MGIPWNRGTASPVFRGLYGPVSRPRPGEDPQVQARDDPCLLALLGHMDSFGGRSGTCTITLTTLYKDLTKQFFGGKLPQYRVTSSKEVSGPWRGRSTTPNLSATWEDPPTQPTDFTYLRLPPVKVPLEEGSQAI